MRRSDVLRLLALLKVTALLLPPVGILVGLGVIVGGVIDFISRNPLTPESILHILFFLLLFLGLYGVVRGTIGFFTLGVELDPEDSSYDLIYEEKVRRTSDYLILVGGALFFLWLL